MKGRISIKDFIQRVKDELVQAQDKSGNAFYELTEVTLEVSFALDASAKAGFDLYVVELGGESKAQQTHKVTLKLTPLPIAVPATATAQPTETSEHGTDAPAPAESPKKRSGNGGGGGGGSLSDGGILGRRGPVYDKVRGPI